MLDDKTTQYEPERDANNKIVKSNANVNVKGEKVFAKISQIVDYLFFLLYGLLAIRLLLALFVANSSNEVVQLIKNITDPFYAPFIGIVPNIRAEGGFTLVLPIIVALAVYMFLHLAINGLLRIFVHRQTTV